MLRQFAALALGLLFATSAQAQPFAFAAIGDMPYNLPADYGRFDTLIGEINRRAPAFTIHVGDIKSGSTRCEDAMFERVLAQFNTFRQPLIYTPGDNEWTDCHRANNGGFDPLERLEAVRRLFFRDDFSLGQTRLPVLRQFSTPGFTRFVENFRWTHNNVAFVTLHVVGSGNNLQRNRAAIDEYVERNAANLVWLRAAFDEARAQNRAALVIALQADMDLDQPPDRRSGYNDTIEALRAGALAFARPVLLIHGDSHIYRIDQPFTGAQNRRIGPVTRLIVHGAQDVHGTMVEVDPADAMSPWAFRPLMIRENLPAARVN